MILKNQILVNGLSQGFAIEYHSPTDVQQKSLNLKLNNPEVDKVTIWNKVMKEVQMKRYASPYEEIPFSNYIQSPIGLVPKDNGKDVKLLFHLSYPKHSNKSINANTPKDLCTVKYPDFNKAIELCIKAGKSCRISKSDMKSAFRNLGLRKSDWQWMILMAESPIDGKRYYFVDKCLPFGASISCAHFQKFYDAISHILRVKSKKDNVNYLDDFLFVALLSALCNAQTELFLAICKCINFPVSIEKTFWANTQMTFLGILIDTVLQIVMIPVEKVTRGKELISNVLNKTSRNLTLKQLQQICGFLNFLGRCVVPGRAFTRRLYAHTANLKLKPHHHIRITNEVKRDLEMWMEFLEHPSVYARGFIDFTRQLQADMVRLTSDASRAGHLGFGCISDKSWMYGQWPDKYIKEYSLSIEYLELFALVTAIITWGERYVNRRIIVHCDNQSVVAMVNNNTSSCKNCMILIRVLVLTSLKQNLRVFATYIWSRDNIESDLLSRLRIKEFLKLENLEENPTAIPNQLWPIQKLWFK